MADDTRRTAYTTAHIDDLPVEIDDERPTTEWKPVRRFFGIGSFGTNLARATQPGDVLTYDHTEVVAAGTRHEELFLIVSGHATYRVDGKEIDAPAGTFLYERPGRGVDLLAVDSVRRVATDDQEQFLSLIHISEPTRRTPISYAVFCLKK